MTTPASNPSFSRRDLLKTTGTVAAASALSSLILPKAYAQEANVVQLALVGCGGRGTGAAANAMSTYGPTKLVAMADVFDDKMNTSYRNLSREFKDKVDVPEERRFIGFDGYKKAMDALKPGDVVMLTTPLAFREVMFKYAVEKGLNVFMEKPVTADGPTSRRILEINKTAVEKNLKVAVGLMCRHCAARGELHDRIQNGEIGDVVLLRAYRQVGPTGSAFAPSHAAYNLETKKYYSELEYQIRNFHGFLWASGGAFSDFLIHNVDESCWMKDAWPVEAKGSGGRHFRGDYVDQNFDTYSVEYTFDDGSKLQLEGRCMIGCDQEFASYAHGSKGSAIISTSSHFPAKSRIFKGQSMTKENEVWAFPQPEVSPYQLEWDHFMEAIRQDRPHNECERGVMASLTTSMGRMACHTGQRITMDQMLNCEHEFAPNIDAMTADGPAPIVADEEGKYPIPAPGIIRKTEYPV